ncbi:MAG: response regulator, partial [Planctomycetes bacterium]|nr:response regulator [Planctomycetota bacterium]
MVSVLLLRAIAEGHKYDQECRAQALDALADVLSSEPDVLIRADAVRAFEDDPTAALSDRGRRVASWWSDRRRAARGAPVLFSDDDPDLVRLLPALLTANGWARTYSCGDAFKTLTMAEEVQSALVVTDLCKPGMWGDVMAEALKKTNPATRGIP